MDGSQRLEPPRIQYRRRPVSVAVDAVSLVISECISITSAIQKHARFRRSSVSVSAILGGNPNPVNLGSSDPSVDGSQDALLTSRWGLRGRRGKSMHDNPIIVGFGKLKHEISGVKDIRSFDAPSLLAPFLHLIQAKGTAAPITILALGALSKFLAYGFISPESPRFAHAMQSLSAAITHCQFDISDSSNGQAEVVLLMILNLMKDMISGPGGDILSDQSVCDLMGRGLAICSQPRFSPVLRRTAETVMVKMCQVIFEHVKRVEVKAVEEAEVSDQKVRDDMDSFKMETTTSDAMETLVGDFERSSSSEYGSKEEELAETPKSRNDDDGTTEHQSDQTEDTQSLDLKPYSLPSVRELFRVLVDFLNPHGCHHADTMVMAMRIIHVALEVAGPFIACHPALAAIVKDHLCCYLFQLVRSDNMVILQESLIVAGTLLTTCRPLLKLQRELFLSYLVACLHPTVEIPREPGIDPSLYAGIPQAPKLIKHPSTPVPVKDRQKLELEGDSRKPDACQGQAMVETISMLSQMPTFMVELFINYDCDTDRLDLCEDVIRLLSRNALPDSATWGTASVPPLCLDALLRYIQVLAERLHDEPIRDGYPDPTRLRKQRELKKIIVSGTAKFDEKPMAGLAYLQAKGIIKDANDPCETAKFLKGTSRVSKVVLGEFLSKRGNERILGAFLDLFDFSGKRVDEALRTLLETFRLPGESPLIATIVEAFSEKYISSAHPLEVADKDGAFILTYAIILLNTDQHNPNVVKTSKRMTLEDFSRNLRGQNAGENFAPEYLLDIFETIKANEIILPDEHDKHAFNYAWRELLLKTESAGKLVICDTNIYDADLFATTWRPIVSALSYVFMSATDDAVFARIVTGFNECAWIATKYKNSEAFDHIIYCLSQMSTLASDIRYNTSLNTEVQVDGSSVMVSELAVRFGRNFRAQLATLVLFRVISGNEALIRESWKYIIRIWLNQFANSLIPSFSSHDISDVPVPPIALQTTSQVIDRASMETETGFFSAFTLYISSYAADDPSQPSDEELESTMCTVDCVKSCKIDSIYANIATFPSSASKVLVEALLDQLPENSQEVVITVRQEGIPSPSINDQDSSSVSLKHDPTVPFILEFCTILAVRDQESVESIGKQVFDIMQGILRDAAQWHPITVSRASYYALKVLKASHDHDFANVPYLLHCISTLPPNVLDETAELALGGLSICIDQPGPLRSEMMTSPDFWKLLQSFSGNAASAPFVFGILEQSITGNPPAIMADNYEAAVALLNEFASAASQRASAEVETGPRRVEQQENEAKKDEQAIARGIKAITILQGMTARIPQLIEQSHLESSEAWSAYWLPIFEVLTIHCTNSCREVRQLALLSLQRWLLSPALTWNNVKEWTAIFESVLFPLMHRLLEPELFSTNLNWISEMRVQVTSLLCKVFLQYLVLLCGWEDMLSLWMKIIEVMSRLVNIGQGDSLEEAVRENLKNVILFMASSGYLVPPKQDPSKEQLWEETWQRIDRFLPDLRTDLALEEPEELEELEKNGAKENTRGRSTEGATEEDTQTTKEADD